MTESSKQRESRIHRILESKRQMPEYQRLDFQNQRKVDVHYFTISWLPKISPVKSEKLVRKEISNKPVVIKANQKFKFLMVCLKRVCHNCRSTEL